MENPVCVAIIGPPLDSSIFVQGDLELLTALLEGVGCKVVGYAGTWGVFHYSWYALPGQG